MAPSPRTVVVVDDDHDIADLVQTILMDHGFKVACLYMPFDSELRESIARLDPDCVLLDGFYGAPAPQWETAAWLASLSRPVPTLMFTDDPESLDEAVLDVSSRAQAAHFVGILPKPFDIDQLIKAVHHALGETVPPSDQEEVDQQTRLFEHLRTARADELATSSEGRAWVTFRAGPERRLYEIYRWRTAGAYFIGRYHADDKQLEPLAQFTDFEALIAFCVTQIE